MTMRNPPRTDRPAYGFFAIVLAAAVTVGSAIPLVALGEVTDLGDPESVVATPPAPSEPMAIHALPKDVPTSFDTPDAYVQLATFLLRAVEAHDWKYVIGLLLVLVIALVRKGAAYAEEHAKEDGWVGKTGAFLSTESGGRLLLFGLSGLTGVAATELAHQQLSWALAWKVLTASTVAAGTWHELVKPYIVPLWTWLVGKLSGRPAAAPATDNPRPGFIRLHLVLALAIASLAAMILFCGRANAAPTPAASYGSLTLAAATAKKVPTTGLYARTTVAVWNLDGVRFWCGWDANVTDTTGSPVEPGGGSLSFDITIGDNSATSTLWCYSVAGTVANGLRFNEIRKGY
jgi:hypothetical protein